MDPLFGAGLALCVCALAALLTGRLAAYQSDGLLAIANGLFSIDDIRLHETLPAIWLAAMCAWCAYLWWTRGGGVALGAVFALCAASSGVCAALRHNLSDPLLVL